VASIILPDRWKRQPQGVVEVDRNHWIVQRGITVYAPMGNAGGYVRGAIRQFQSDTVARTPNSKFQGLVANFNGSQYINVGTTPPATAYTLAGWATHSASGTHTICALNDASSNLAVRLICGGNPGPGGLSTNGYTVNATENVGLNTWQHVVGVVGGAADHRAYSNGGNKGTNTTSDTRSPTGITIGGYQMWGALTSPLNGLVSNVLILPWAMTDDEVFRLYVEQRDTPWKIFKPSKRVIYFDAPSFPTLSSLSVSNITSSGGRLTASA
jgi:hypothetical protein